MPSSCARWLLLSLLLGTSSPLHAQRQAVRFSRGFAIGASFENLFVAGEGNGHLGLLSFRMSGFDPDGDGVEASLAIAPPLLTRESGTVALADLDYMRGVSLGGPVALLKVGAGFLVAGGGTPTLNAGLGLVVPLSRRIGFRVDGSIHSLALAFLHINFFSVGVGLMGLP